MTDSPSGAPFLKIGDRSAAQTFWCVGLLLALGGLYSLFYEPFFILRLAAYMLFATGLEVLYRFVLRRPLRLRTAGSALTAGLLVMSIPAEMPPLAICLALMISIWIVKLPGRLPLNAAITGRFFLMLAFGSDIVRWSFVRQELDGLTGATPLEIWHSDGYAMNHLNLFFGRIHENWEGLYQIIPGAPGELFRPILILFGLFLLLRGIIDWRGGVSFLAAFALTCAALGEPPGFHLLSGAVLFVAVFIVTDPRSSPMSRGGRIFGCALAGILNGAIRHFTFYSEGIVWSVLAMNLLTPLIDRVAFRLRSGIIDRRRHRLAQRLAAQHTV